MSRPSGWDDPDRRDRALDKVAARVAHHPPARHKPSPAELDVLRCYSVGMTRPMVAEALGRSPFTVQEQSRKAIRRLAAKNIAHAVALAIRAGYIA